MKIEIRAGSIPFEPHTPEMSWIPHLPSF